MSNEENLFTIEILESETLTGRPETFGITGCVKELSDYLESSFWNEDGDDTRMVKVVDSRKMILHLLQQYAISGHDRLKEDIGTIFNELADSKKLIGVEYL